MNRSITRGLGLAGASVLFVVVALAAAATPALAQWAATTMSASAGRSLTMALATGNVPSVSSPVLSHSVNVSWAPATGGAPVAGYEIKAFNAVTGAARTVGGGCSGIVSGSSCTDTGVPNGTWKYSVTARQQLWRGAESARSFLVLVAGL